MRPADERVERMKRTTFIRCTGSRAQRSKAERAVYGRVGRGGGASGINGQMDRA